MPVKTPKFGLEAFVRGDQFSALIDKRRFLTIDSHLNFLSNLIGDGIIEGWGVTANGGLTITVAAGWGVIDGFVTRTFTDFEKTLADNKTFKIYLKRRDGVIGTASAFSNMTTTSYTDITAPSAPSGLDIDSTTISSFTFSWDEATEFDFDHYDVYFSTDNITFTQEDETSSNSYTFTDLSDNTIYYVKLKAVDLTGNESSFSSTLSVTTSTDTTQPPDPVDVRIFNGENKIQISYLPPAFSRIGGYRATATPVSSITLQPVGDSVVATAGSDELNIIIDGLDNNQRYSVVVQTVSENDIASEGVTILAYPQPYPGPEELESVSISDRESTNAVSDVVIDLSWIPSIDPYDPNPPASYEIVIVESDIEGTIQSQPIGVLGTERSIQLFPVLQDDGSVIFRAIRTRTRYYVSVRAVDSEGNRSPGIFKIFNTRSFEAPNSPTVLDISQRLDQSLLITWNNSTSEFVNNVLTVTKVTSTTTETIVDALSIGRSNSYIIEQSDVDPQSTFLIELYAVDEFGNESAVVFNSFFVPNASVLPLPPEPSQQIGTAGDRRCTISWSRPDIGYVKGYRIWRARKAATYEASSFQIVETILDSDVLEYNDYEVVNTRSYVYFVTTLDIFDRETPNPIDDEFFDYRLITLTPNSSSQLTFPENVDVTVAAPDITITWDASSGQFDGYEIFRSIGNKYEFEKVGETSPTVTSFVDTNATLKSGTFFYLVRKVFNEADLFITESTIAPSGSLLLADVVTSDGIASIDTSVARVVANLESPIKEEVEAQIAVHKHRVVNEFGVTRDRRINLGNTITVSDWISDETFRRYTTLTNLSEATTYTVFLNGEIASVLSTLDLNRGVLVFDEPLAPGNALGADDISGFPFDSPPTVEVVFDNLAETQSILESERVRPLSSQQVSSGDVNETTLPDISHNGRIREPLIPLQIPTINVSEGYTYRPYSMSDTDFQFKVESGLDYYFIGSAVTFYDIEHAREPDGTLEDYLIAVTSDGFLTSTNFGVTWSRRRYFPTPGHKIFYSDEYRVYFVLSNRGIYFSPGLSERRVTDPDTGEITTEEFIDFSSWSEMSGTETTKIVRDIVVQPNGVAFCTSDLGVYKLLVNDSRTVFFWQQVPIFGPESTDMYAILYDDTRERTIVSNELGIFETDNDGVLWEFSDEFPDQRPIFEFHKVDDTIYAITNDIVWRRRLGDVQFTRIAELDVDAIRRITVWKGRLFITTSDGLLISKPESDIENDVTVEFELAFPQMNIGQYTALVHGLQVLDNKLFIGTEKRLFCADRPGDIALQSDIPDGIVPTIFVDGVEQRIGYRYSTASNTTYKNVNFDIKQSLDATVTIANQYKRFKAQNGGWADTKFDANVIMRVDGLRVNDGSIAESVIKSIDPTTVIADASENAKKVFTTEETLTIASDEQAVADAAVAEEYSSENVAAMFNASERVLSQMYWRLDDLGCRLLVSDYAFPETSLLTGEFTETYYIDPDMRVALLTDPNGDISLSDFGMTSFGRYGDQEGSGGAFGSEFNSEESA